MKNVSDYVTILSFMCTYYGCITCFPFRLCIGFLPMILHLHQCQLDFLVNFFGERSSSGNRSSGQSLDSDGSKSISTTKSQDGLTLAEEALLPYFQASYGKFLMVMHVGAAKTFTTHSLIVVPTFVLP